jgi:hypothetical protein
VEIGWNLWGMLPHLLPQEGDWRSFNHRVIMANMKNVVVCAPYVAPTERGRCGHCCNASTPMEATPPSE